MTTFGFTQSYPDYSLFTLTQGTIELRILVYVDDLLVCGNDIPTLTKFKEYLSRCFHMKDLGKPKYFLGLEVARNNEDIFLSQRKYILDIIAESGMLGSKPVYTPMEQNHRLGLDTSPLLSNPARYRRLVGRLIYPLVTRPDLCYSVHSSHSLSKLHEKVIGRQLFELCISLKAHPVKGFFASYFRIASYCVL